MGSEQDTEDYSNIWDFEFTKLQLTQVTEPWPAGPDNHDDHDMTTVTIPGGLIYIPPPKNTSTLDYAYPHQVQPSINH